MIVASWRYDSPDTLKEYTAVQHAQRFHSIDDA